ncbi:glycosyltransferase family 2 protein [Methylothermus subterraneus]
MPAKDEAAAIGEVIAQVKRHFPKARLVVIDDASQDATAEVAAQAGVTVLPLAVPLGAWGAIQTGMRYALKQNIAVCVTMDADGQHLAAEIPKLLNALERERAEVAIGAYPERGSRARRIAWRLFRTLTGFEFADLTSGFRAYRGRALALLASPRATLLEYQDLGVLLLLRAHGVKIAETAVVMRPRAHGKSRVFSSWWRVGAYLGQTLVLCLANLRVKK